MIAVIPARGGSKGIPGKNICDLAGRPLIAYTIEAARAARHIDRVVVSTDSAEIAQVAERCGADVPFLRAGDLARDDSLAIDVYLDVLTRLGGKMNAFCVLQPTSPLRSQSDIDQAIEMFHRFAADSVISVCEAPHPLSWFRTLDEDSKLAPLQKSGGKPANRQVEKKLYIPNGAVYVLSSEFFRHSRSYYSDLTFGYVMPRERSVDIDVPFDLSVAEMLILRAKAEGKQLGTT